MVDNKEEKTTEIVDLDMFTHTAPLSNREGSNKSKLKKSTNGINEAKKQVNGKHLANVETDFVNNLVNRNICICEKEVKPEDVTLYCETCERRYHC